MLLGSISGPNPTRLTPGSLQSLGQSRVTLQVGPCGPSSTDSAPYCFISDSHVRLVPLLITVSLDQGVGIKNEDTSHVRLFSHLTTNTYELRPGCQLFGTFVTLVLS